jgi:outer membrane lipoprotein-sorting protein
MMFGKNNRMKWLLSLSLTLSLCSSAVSHAGTETVAPAWGIKQLMLSLSQVKSSKARFVEQKYLAMLTFPAELSGTLIYKAPSRFEKHTLTPNVESMILDQDKIVFENPGKQQKHQLSLQDYPAIRGMVESIRSTLAGDLTTLNRFYNVKLEGNAAKWQLILLPSETKIKFMINEILISGSDNHINTIEIKESEGDRSVMTLKEDNS